MLTSRSFRLLFGLEILAFASYFWHQTVSAFGRQWTNRPALHILVLVGYLILFAWGLVRLQRLTSRYLQTKTGLMISDLSRPFILSLSPGLLLFLIFLQSVVFLKDIRGYLLPISMAGIVCLFFSFRSRLKRTYPQAVPTPELITKWHPERIPLRRLTLLLLAISLTVYIVLATGLVLPAQPFTGDEPHYLLITKSIIKDGDINLANNYGNQDYLDFYPGRLRPHAHPGRKGNDYLYSQHFPALPLLLVPAYLLGEKMSRLHTPWTDDPASRRRVIVFFSRLPLCFFTAFFGLVFFRLIFDLTQRKTLSVSAWAIFGFTTPVIFFSQLIYPEIPVALITILVLRNLVFKKESRPSRLFFSAAGIAVLPWFSIKFIVLSALLFVPLSAGLIKSRRALGHLKRMLLTFPPIVLSAALYLFSYWYLYGTFSAIPVYKGSLYTSASRSGIFSFILRKDPYELIRRIPGYFLDQRVGLFIYSPIFILGIAGFLFFFKQKRKESLLLLAVFSVYGVFSAYYYWGGFCPPGRPLIPILWILALFLVVALQQNRTRIRDAIIRATAGLSFLVAWVALRNPWILYHEDISSDYTGKALGSNLFRMISNSFVDFQKWIPYFFRTDPVNLIPLIFWTACTILIVAIYITKNEKKETRSFSTKLGIQTMIVFFVSLLVLTYIFFDIHLERKEVYQSQDTTLYFQDDNNYGKELEGFWTKGKSQTSVLLASQRPAEAIRITIHGLVEGRTTIRVGPAEKKIRRSKTQGLGGEVSFSGPVGFRLGKDYLYMITISDTSGFYPYRLDKSAQDNRYLGVFVKIER
jgi:hypothetical protein